MDAESLTPTEVLALAGLALHLASADGQLSEQEADELKSLGEEIGGADTFRTALATAEQRFKTAEHALDYASEVTRSEARELIHTVLYDLANADEVDPAEADLLARLRLMWGIKSP